jgi:hypothetical protein
MAGSRDPLFQVVVMLGAAAATGACGEANRGPDRPAVTGGMAGASAGLGGEGATLAGPSAAGQSAINPGGAPNDPCSEGGANGGMSLDAASVGEAGAFADCPPAQLRCTSYTPTPTECSCDPQAPLSACDCTDRNWTCMVFDPPMGCTCSYITGPR